MFAKNWTGFVEYNYIEFDKKNEAFAFGRAPGLTINADLKNKLSIAKVGVNYQVLTLRPKLLTKNPGWQDPGFFSTDAEVPQRFGSDGAGADRSSSRGRYSAASRSSARLRR